MSKKLFTLFLALLMLCSAALADQTGITVTDGMGRDITFTEPVTRIVALSASDCEIICALGCEDRLVGRGQYCNYPESIAAIPAVLSGADANIEQILALNPQVLLMSAMAQTKEQVRLLEENGVKVIVSDNTDISGAYDAIAAIGHLLGKDAEAEALIADMKAAFDAITEQTRAGETVGKSVYFEVSPLEWGRLYTAGSGTFMDEIAQICGLENAFADIDGWASVSVEQVMERNPDYIISVSGMPDTRALIMAREGWSELTAIVHGDVMEADPDAFSRPAPRLKDAAESLYRFITHAD